MTVMVGVAAAAGSSSASGGSGQRSMNFEFWKGRAGGYYDGFGSVHYNDHGGKK